MQAYASRYLQAPIEKNKCVVACSFIITFLYRLFQRA